MPSFANEFAKISNFRWNKKCRSRVFTIGDTVTPLNKYHTHEDIIHRKKRVARKKQEMKMINDTENEDVEFYLMQDKKDASEDDASEIYVAYDN